MLTFAKKAKLLDMLKEGISFAAVGHLYNINQSTVHYVKKDKKNIHKTTSFTFSKTANRVVTPCNKTTVKMESSLALWIAEKRT